MSSMQAMQLTHPGPSAADRLTLIERDVPVPGPGEVVITVQSCAMCRTDLQIAAGDLPARKLPIVPGHQVVGRIAAAGPGVLRARIGQAAGLVWLADACGQCRFCLSGRENLCPSATFTGWDQDGGYATSVVAKDRYAFDLSSLESRPPESIAPLLCAGVVGYRSLRIAELSAASSGARLGLYGYGSSARIVLRIARHWGIDVYVVTRSRAEAEAALAAGAQWAGTYSDQLPIKLDAAITFAPVGSVVVGALQAVERGGIVAINAIHLDEIPQFNYDDLWLERSLRSVANVTSADVGEFIQLVAATGLETEFEVLPLEHANEGLRRIEDGDVSGSLVLSPQRGAGW